MPKFNVLMYHTRWNAYGAVIEADNEQIARSKALALWEQDGGEQFDRRDDQDQCGDLEVAECEEVKDVNADQA